MKIASTLIVISFVITACSSLATVEPDDGYAMYVQACQHHDSLGLTSGSVLRSDICAVVHHGEAPSSNLVAFLQEEQRAFTLIEDAHKQVAWRLPDITTISCETRFPCLTAWLGLHRVVTVRAIQLHLEESSRASLSFLVPFNATGLRVSKAGGPMHLGVHIAGRSMQYPVLASSIDDLSNEALATELARARGEYEEIAPFCDYMRGEQYMEINTVKGFFSDLRTQLKPTREQMVESMKDAGVDETTLKKIEEGELLSVSDWEREVLSDLSSLQAFYTNALSSRSSSELGRLDDDIEARIDRIGDGVERKVAMAAWNLYMTNQVSGSFSVPDARRLHAEVGRSLSHQLLDVMMPSIGGLGISYREFIASERLLLIRLAIRLYIVQHHRPPSSLQQLVDSELLDQEMICDPLSGERFLTKKATPLEAYSVGRDLDDDNGAPWHYKTESGDTILIPLKNKWSSLQERCSLRSKPPS